METDALMRLGPSGVFRTVRFTYVDRDGVDEIRTVKPVRLRWGSLDPEHPSGWLMDGYDWDAGAERTFALQDIDMSAGLVLVSMPKPA